MFQIKERQLGRLKNSYLTKIFFFRLQSCWIYIAIKWLPFFQVYVKITKYYNT